MTATLDKSGHSSEAFRRHHRVVNLHDMISTLMNFEYNTIRTNFHPNFFVGDAVNQAIQLLEMR